MGFGATLKVWGGCNEQEEEEEEGVIPLPRYFDPV